MTGSGRSDDGEEQQRVAAKEDVMSEEGGLKGEGARQRLIGRATSSTGMGQRGEEKVRAGEMMDERERGEDVGREVV